MVEVPRLNGVIRTLERGDTAFVAMAVAEFEPTIALSTSKYDAVVFDMEHSPWDAIALRNALHWLLNRRQIALSGSIVPAVTPFVRVPAHGSELNQWLAQQALDAGVYGIVWPHVSTVDEARAAVAACRYPRPQTAPMYEPAGRRGDGPATAIRYWGVTQEEYYAKADVWPLNPAGEIVVVLMIESAKGVENLPDILKQVPGIGVILIGDGDLSQDLGVPRQYNHPAVVDAMARVVATCKQYNVPVGRGHVDQNTMDLLLKRGYRLLVASPTRDYSVLDKGRSLTVRK